MSSKTFSETSSYFLIKLVQWNKGGEAVKDDYMQLYILSYFRENRTSSVSQILHVFHGKRTPSMFYMIEANQWHHGFSYDSMITRTGLQQVIDRLVKQRYLRNEGKGYVLTESGLDQIKTYFKSHYYPRYILSFKNANVRQPFWRRFQLFTQVFSELSYKNAQYTPVIKHPHHHENVRQLFQQFPEDKEKLLEQWVLEQEFLFSMLDEVEANVLASQLNGHGKIGKTNNQVAKALQMTNTEFYFYKQDNIEQLIERIRENQSGLMLTAAILKQLDQETNRGLSISTKETYTLIRQGHNIQQIAQIRSIKENTVREHILEIAFVFLDFPYKQFIPKDIYQQLHQQFEKREDYDYRTAMSENEAVEFMHFRLVELERMRMS